MLANDGGTFSVAAESAAFTARFPKAEVCIPATEEPVALTRVTEGLQKPLLSCAVYPRWFEILGCPASLPQLILSWPWVMFGRGSRGRHRQLPMHCRRGWCQAGRSAPGVIHCWCPKICVAFHVAGWQLAPASAEQHTPSVLRWAQPGLTPPGPAQLSHPWWHRIHVLAGLEPLGVSCGCN